MLAKCFKKSSYEKAKEQLRERLTQKRQQYLEQYKLFCSLRKKEAKQSREKERRQDKRLLKEKVLSDLSTKISALKEARKRSQKEQNLIDEGLEKLALRLKESRKVLCDMENKAFQAEGSIAVEWGRFEEEKERLSEAQRERRLLQIELKERSEEIKFSKKAYATLRLSPSDLQANINEIKVGREREKLELLSLLLRSSKKTLMKAKEKRNQNLKKISSIRSEKRQAEICLESLQSERFLCLHEVEAKEKRLEGIREKIKACEARVLEQIAP